MSNKTGCFLLLLCFLLSTVVVGAEQGLLDFFSKSVLEKQREARELHNATSAVPANSTEQTERKEEEEDNPLVKLINASNITADEIKLVNVTGREQRLEEDKELSNVTNIEIKANVDEAKNGTIIESNNATYERPSRNATNADVKNGTDFENAALNVTYEGRSDEIAVIVNATTETIKANETVEVNNEEKENINATKVEHEMEKHNISSSIIPVANFSDQERARSEEEETVEEIDHIMLNETSNSQVVAAAAAKEEEETTTTTTTTATTTTTTEPAEETAKPEIGGHHNKGDGHKKYEAGRKKLKDRLNKIKEKFNATRGNHAHNHNHPHTTEPTA